MQKNIYRFLGIIIILLSLGSCFKKEQTAAEDRSVAAAPESAVSEKDDIKETGLEAVLRNEVIISFLTGDVFIIRGSDETYAEIGDSVLQDDTLQTGPDGYCELQIGGKAIISISGNTDFTLASVSLNAQGSQFQGKMNAGTIALKVNKLLNKDRFYIETPSSVCGVRGTRFLVRVNENKTTDIAVSEGEVAVLSPKAVELKNIMDTSSDELAAVLEKILKNETTVEAGSQISVQEDDLAEISNEIEKVVAAIEDIEDKSEEEVLKVIHSVETMAIDVETAVEKTAAPEVITSFNSEILKPMENIEIIPLEKQVKMLPLKINVLPSNADIYLDGNYKGKGNVSVLYEENATVEILIRAPGYDEKIESITIGKENIASFKLEKSKRKIILKVEPEDTLVFLKGKELGTGKQTGNYALGSTLLFTGRRDGYNPASLEVRVNETSASEYLLKLSRGLRKFVIKTEPSDAVLTINGQPSGKGSFSGEFAFGETVDVSVSQDGYKTYNQTLVLDESVPNELLVSLEASDVSLTILSFRPGTEIKMNGLSVGNGSASQRFPFSSDVSVSVSNKGYETLKFSVSLTTPGKVTKNVRLKALPEWGRYNLSSQPLVGELVINNQAMAAIDSQGKLMGITLNGSGKWTYDTGNGKNEASFPVLIDNSVLFAGISRLVSVDVKNGRNEYSRDLGSQDSLPFGNRPIIAGDTIVYPEQEGLRFFNRDDFSEKGYIALGGLLMTTPSVREDEVYVVDLKGVIHKVSLNDFSLLSSFQTSLKQPAGIQMTIDGRVGYMGDTKGTFIAIDLIDNRVIWRQAVDSRVADSPLVYMKMVYILSGSNLLSFSADDGSFKGQITDDAVTAPVTSDGVLYYGDSDKNLVAWNISKKKIEWSYSLKSKATTKVVKSGSLVAVGLENGEIVVLNEKAFN